MLTDYHMHTPLCRHASGTAAEYVAAAKAAGLAEIGFSDHSPMPRYYDDWRMLAEELPLYFDWIAEARAAAGDMPVRVGTGSGLAGGRRGWIESLAARAPWDYLIGSVHYIGASGGSTTILRRSRNSRFGAEKLNSYWDSCAGRSERVVRHDGAPGPDQEVRPPA